MVRISINGFGRIGRLAFRVAVLNHLKEAEVVAINTSGSMDAAGWAYLLKYDTIYGRFPREIKVVEPAGSKEIGALEIEGRRYPILAEKDLLKIPWYTYQPQVVLEATGVFRSWPEAEKHLLVGAEKVIISAPPKSKEIPIYLVGVNLHRYRGEKIISNGSCTTNCVAPVVKVIKDEFGIGQAVLTTIHAYTADQELVDGSHKDLRRGRSAALNIIPTETGAAESVVAIFPDLKGKFAGTAIRVPVGCGSFSDLTFKLEKKVTVDAVNRAFQKAAEEKLKEILSLAYDPIVSSDIVGNSASAIVDMAMTNVVEEDFIQIGVWYDNEMAYAHRLVEEAIVIGK
ncbi:MAG: Glyceraldehyde-3-phosphate dehydrogenase [Microgenomates group bacterium ADurb.Bin219]|nr:MAG: Glyceraldehyde-3-phosphate dehydrogenase [Microgenomates group bacterium ADurb.Bin219]HNP89053.1 glyceraldehyde 3-phosphate dehydrogenase NAD-binding domain-containing protein [Candidatus Woesebacteria bacterium]